MKRAVWSLGLSVLCVLGAMGIAGCEDDDTNPPASISGSWSCTFTRSGESSLQENWIFTQDGDTVNGSYTFDQSVWTFSGTYDDDDGEFNGVDADGWVIRLEFDDDVADGTISGDGETWQARLIRQ